VNITIFVCAKNSPGTGKERHGETNIFTFENRKLTILNPSA
jgi:hypothetical protein